MVSCGEEDDEGMAGGLCPFAARSGAAASDSLPRWARGKLGGRSLILIPLLILLVLLVGPPPPPPPFRVSRLRVRGDC